MSDFTDSALALLAGGLPALDGVVNGQSNAFPETTPPTGTLQGYEPGLFNTSSGMSTGSVVAIGLGLAAVLAIVVLATR